MKEIEQKKFDPKPTKKKAPLKFCYIEKDGRQELTCKINQPTEKQNSQGIYQGYLQNLTGTKDTEIALEIIERAVKALPQDKKCDHNNNVVIQELADFQPKSAEEARLATQAAVLYARGMRYLNLAENSIQQMSDAGVFDMVGLVQGHNTQTTFALKLLRLHNETIETLSRLRRGNDQKITVQHVQVNDGGQAMVGNFQAGG